MTRFYGFKLPLIINDKGEILSFYLTKGSVNDRNIKLMTSMTEQIFGKLFGDKGYQTPIGQHNFLMNTMGALCAYHSFPKKTSLDIMFETNDNNQLLLAAYPNSR